LVLRKEFVLVVEDGPDIRNPITFNLENI